MINYLCFVGFFENFGIMRTLTSAIARDTKIAKILLETTALVFAEAPAKSNRT